MFSNIVRLAVATIAAAAAPQVARLDLANYHYGSGNSRSLAEIQAEELKKLESLARVEAAIEKMATIKEDIKAPARYSPSHQGSDLSVADYEKALAKQTAHCDDAVKELKDIMALLRQEAARTSELSDASNLYKEAYKCSSAIRKTR